MRAPGKDGLEEDAKLFCAELLRAPHVAALFVNAPAGLAARAEEQLVAARAAKSDAREVSALRLYAAAVLWAMHPGNYSLAASVLADTEETVRKHYGHEDGARAAAEVRKALLASPPTCFGP